MLGSRVWEALFVDKSQMALKRFFGNTEEQKKHIGPEGVSKGFSPEICRPNHDPFPDAAFPSHVENKKQEKTSNIRFKGAHSPSLERQHLHGKPVFYVSVSV